MAKGVTAIQSDPTWLVALQLDNGAVCGVPIANIQAWFASTPGATPDQAEMATLQTLQGNWTDATATVTLDTTFASDGTTSLNRLAVRYADGDGFDVYMHCLSLNPVQGAMALVKPDIPVAANWFTPA